MGLWSIITGVGKAGEVIDTGMDVVKMGASGLDKLVYTKEEKAIDGAKNIAVNMDHAITMARIAQNECGASAVTRRLVFLIVLGNFTIYAQAALIAACFNRIDIVTNIIKTATAIMLGEMAIAVAVSMAGYYAATKGRK